jgi:hypothetical protein
MADPVSEWPVTTLEQRVERLESAVAALQDTQALEDRVAERVTGHLQGQVNVQAERIAAAERNTSANAATALMTAAAQTAFRAATAPALTAPLTRAPWLVLDLFREATAIFRMFVDLHYKVGWATRILTLLLLPAILTSQWWLPFPHIPILFDVVDKLVDLLLAFVMLKALGREAHRYLESRTPLGGT